MLSVKTSLELIFDSIAFECGGHITSELHPYLEHRARGLPPQDADYFFPKYATLAELKRLDVNTFAPVDDPRIQQMSAAWVRKGLIPAPRSKRWKWDLRALPEPCQREAIAFLRKPIRRVVTKANSQIKQTNITLELPSSTKGLLLLASDGNTVLHPETVVTLLARTFAEPNFSNVHSLVYFNYTILADSPVLNSDVMFWIDSAIRDGGVSRFLLHTIEQHWFQRIEARFGKIRRIDANEALLADLRY